MGGFHEIAAGSPLFQPHSKCGIVCVVHTDSCTENVHVPGALYLGCDQKSHFGRDLSVSQDSSVERKAFDDLYPRTFIVIDAQKNPERENH